jgi:hypothetical protein
MPKIVAYLLLGFTDSGGYIKFTPKFTIVGGEGRVSDFVKGCNLILLVTQDHMQSFKIVAYLFLGYFWLVKKMMIKTALIIKASLATAEVSAGG